MTFDLCISQTTQQELPKASSLILKRMVWNTGLLSIGVKNNETVEKLEFSSFSNALNINTGKLHPIPYHTMKGTDRV